MKNLVTGATGFVGSHIAEKLKQEGEEVIALARESSDTGFLEESGIEIRYGCVTDPCSVYQATKGIERVYHAAALTDEWVAKEESYEVNVEGTANILQAAFENKIDRFFFVSSLAVMGFKNHYNTAVVTDYIKARDPYIDTKIEAEKFVWRFNKFGLATTILRPGFMYGPRDRRFMRRILSKLEKGSFRFVGGGKNILNLNYVGNFADAVVLAGKTPRSIGQAYNIANDDKNLDMQTFIFKVADLWGYARPKSHIPVKAAQAATCVMERFARLMRRKEPPLLTKTRLKFLSHNLEFDISKTKEELGFENKIDIDQGLYMTKQWIEASHAYEGRAHEKDLKKKRLPYTYRDRMTIDNIKYKDHVRNELHQLREKQGNPESIIRLERILAKPRCSSRVFEIRHFRTADSQIIYFNKWKSDKPEHIFVYLNGLESHAGWFSDTACDLAKKGIVVYGLDRRGSGLNSRNIGEYQDWVRDVNMVMKIAKKENPEAKLHLVSTCLGAKIATACAIQQPEEIDSLIYMSPGLRVKVKPTLIEKLKIALDVLPGLSFNIPSPMREDEMFTDSAEALYFLYNDKLRTFSPRASDFYQAGKIGSYVLRNLGKLRTRSIVLLAGKDQIVDNVRTRKAFSRFGERPEIIEYSNSEHVLFFGASKAELICDMTAFIRRSTSAQEL